MFIDSVSCQIMQAPLVSDTYFAPNGVLMICIQWWLLIFRPYGTQNLKIAGLSPSISS
jgi:hypothetical protein